MSGITSDGAGEVAGEGVSERLALLDYRRQVAAMYAAVRREEVAIEERWTQLRAQREGLFRDHPLLPLPPDRRAQAQLPFFDYDPQWRVTAQVAATAPVAHTLQLRDDGDVRLTRLGVAQFEVVGRRLRLPLQWVGGCGGGLLLSFRDGTSGRETYGGGRYLLDTIKGADLGGADLGGGERTLVLDFNFAYNPSCAYDPRWHCPLPDRDSWLDVEGRAGERMM